MSPVETKPYGPGRLAIVLTWPHDLTRQQADEIRARAQAALPA